MHPQAFQVQQIANFLQSCSLNLLDRNSEFSFAFDPITGEWELLTDMVLPDGESLCSLKVRMTDNGFEFLIYNSEFEVIYEEPLQSVSRLRKLMANWRNELHNKYIRCESLIP